MTTDELKADLNRRWQEQEDKYPALFERLGRSYYSNNREACWAVTTLVDDIQRAGKIQTELKELVYAIEREERRFNAAP